MGVGGVVGTEVRVGSSTRAATSLVAVNSPAWVAASLVPVVTIVGAPNAGRIGEEVGDGTRGWNSAVVGLGLVGLGLRPVAGASTVPRSARREDTSSRMPRLTTYSASTNTVTTIACDALLERILCHFHCQP